MSLLDSFTVNHTMITAPSVRMAKIIKTFNSDIITVFDLRFCKPNVNSLTEFGIHTLEHLLAVFMRNHLNSEDIKIIDISPMGCRTGFYMSLIGSPKENSVVCAWKKSMKDVLQVKEQNQILEINIYQCGNYKSHSLEEAHGIARNILKQHINIIYNKNLKLTKEQLQNCLLSNT